MYIRYNYPGLSITGPLIGDFLVLPCIIFVILFIYIFFNISCLIQYIFIVIYIYIYSILDVLFHIK